MKKMKTLPDKLSELIVVMIRDARSLNRKVYQPKSKVFHRPGDEDGCCYINDAGAVMAGTLGGSRRGCICPSDFPESVERKLEALNFARKGKYHKAVMALDKFAVNAGPLLEGIPSSRHAAYDTWDEFDRHLRHMGDVATALGRLGW